MQIKRMNLFVPLLLLMPMLSLLSVVLGLASFEKT